MDQSQSVAVAIALPTHVLTELLSEPIAAALAECRQPAASAIEQPT